MSRQSLTMLFPIAILLGAGVAAWGLQAPQKPIRTAMPYVFWTGSNSSHGERAFVRITDAPEWARLWQAHMGDRIERDTYQEPVVPQIDFKACMVIAVFEGKIWNVKGEDLRAIEEFDNRVRIRIERSSYQTFGQDPNGGGQSVTPYAIYVVPRLSKPLTIEMNTQNLIGKPPIWTAQAEFPELPSS